MTDDEIRAMVEVPVDSLEPSPAELGDTITVTPNEWTPIGDNGTEIYVYGDQPITLVVRA